MALGRSWQEMQTAFWDIVKAGQASCVVWNIQARKSNDLDE
jgi:hypothetical protein